MRKNNTSGKRRAVTRIVVLAGLLVSVVIISSLVKKSGSGDLVTAVEAQPLTQLVGVDQSTGITEALGPITRMVGALIVVILCIYIGLFVVEIILVMAIAGGIDKMAPSTALKLFLVYSGLMGISMSVVFLTHNLGTISLAFGTTSIVFISMSLIGLTMKKDLSDEGPILSFALMGLIIVSVVNIFFQSNFLEWAVSVAGVIIFMGLTVYDSQAIKQMTFEALSNGETQVANRIGVLGALMLYLNFINLFLFILSFLGGGDD